MTSTTPILDALLTRRSLKPKLLQAPAPDMQTLQLCARTALRAPNHGNLPVCRFILIDEASREKLGELFRAASLRSGADEEKAARRASKALKGPMLVGFIIRRFDGAEAPLDEQLITAGAALENFLLALQACGFGAIVLSDSCREDPELKSALGIDPDETLCGWITIGTPASDGQPVPESRPEPLSVWKM